MTMEQIDFFLMAVRCDTFLEAAENLHIAQSTLSKQIQKLEAELNLPLFNRTRRQAVLTLSAGSHGTLPPVSPDAAENASLSENHTPAAPCRFSSVFNAVSSHFPHPGLHARTSGNRTDSGRMRRDGTDGWPAVRPF